MTVLQTVLVFVGIPVAVCAVVYALVYVPKSGSRKHGKGAGEDFAPVWFLARPEDVSVAGASDYVAAMDEHRPKAIEDGSSVDGISVKTGAKGGASGNW
ncbi:MAG TPA: hypothetical protein H9902_04760 [Candidatus Stackebrandtia faecavium]|nr:hypothetical protein [Candidatus Stackebrandtia faecavium]